MWFSKSYGECGAHNYVHVVQHEGESCAQYGKQCCADGGDSCAECGAQTGGQFGQNLSLNVLLKMVINVAQCGGESRAECGAQTYVQGLVVNLVPNAGLDFVCRVWCSNWC